MPDQNINDVLLAVTLAMLKNSDHSRLNASYAFSQTSDSGSDDEI